MKILHIAPTPFFADRGCHIRILGEVEQLLDRGHSVVITTYHNGRNIGNLQIERIINIPWYTKLEAGGSWHKLYLDLLLLWRSIRTAIRFKPDIIHGHLHEGALIGWMVSQLAFRGKIPVIFDVQGSLSGEMEAYGLIQKKSVLRALMICIEKMIYKLPDRLVCSSKENERYMVSKMKVPDNKITVLNDGIDPDFFSIKAGNGLNKVLNIERDHKVVLYTGSLLSSKGIHYLLEAIPLVLEVRRDAVFLIVGHPVEQSRSRIEALGVGDYVRFTGKVDFFDLPAYLNMADLAVDPKISGAGEASGKILNYMGAGLPIVCFDTVNNRNLLGASGIFAKPGSTGDFARAIVDALGLSGRSRSAGDANRRRARERFSWEATVNRLLSVYQSTIESVIH